MSFVTDLFSGLTGFRDHLVTTAEEAAAPVLAAVESHLARLEPLVRANILAAEDEGRAILHELYGSVVSEVKTEVESPAPAPAAEPTETSATAEPAPATPSADAVPEAAAADPTQAPSTTTEASSAPSSTPSDSATDAAAPAAQ